MKLLSIGLSEVLEVLEVPEPLTGREPRGEPQGKTLTRLVGPFLDALTTPTPHAAMRADAEHRSIVPGVAHQHIRYHTWYHLGEHRAIRPMLGHSDLPELMGAIEAEAPALPHLSSPGRFARRVGNGPVVLPLDYAPHCPWLRAVGSQ